MTSIKTDPFQAAINKAQAVSPKVIFLGTHNGESGWKVKGSSKLSYYCVFQTTEGCTCNCPAGQQDKPCYHRAAVLLNKLATDAADLFLAALDASIASQRVAQEDAKLQAAVGAWWRAQYGDLTAAQVADLEEEREETAFWQDFNAARENIISAVTVWIDGYLPKEPPMQETKRMMCLVCDRWHDQSDPKAVARLAPAFCSERCRKEWNAPRCKSCGKRCDAQTGLCQPCLMVQEALRKSERKAQTCTRMAAHVNDTKEFSIFKAS